MATRMSLVSSESVTFLGAPFDMVEPADVIETIRARRKGQPFRYIVTPNVDHVVRLSRQPELRAAYEGAWLSLCDSHPVRFLGRLLGHRLPHFTGADLTLRMFGEVLEAGDEIAVLGANEGIIEDIRQRFPQLTITAHVPPMGFAKDEQAFGEAVAFGATSKARFLFLAVGAPQSELVAQEIAATPGATGTALCIGASLEFLTEQKRRAPQFMRDTGTEWIFRFASEPQRLWRRYVLGVTPLAMLFLGEVFRRGPDTKVAARSTEVLTPAVAVAQPPLVLHITGDYPDPVRAPTTQAIKRLIDDSKGARHLVFSLDRTVNPFATYLKECPAPDNQKLFAYGHFGLPLGIGHFASFWLVARRIEAVLAKQGLRPDAVHAHRLTFDGIAGWLIARRRGIPLLLSVRGEVESKVFRFKPLYRPLLRRIAADAARIYYVSAWYQSTLERMTGADPKKSRALPNAVHNTRVRIVPRAPEPAFVAIANLDITRKKGINRLIEAFGEVAAELPGVRLDIIGTGKPAAVAMVEGLVSAAGLGERVRLLGALPNAVLLERLPSYLALALPSRNETFGMVYTEALFAGVPILYSRQTGIDGYLDGLDVGVGVDPNDIAEIGRGLVALARDNGRYRTAIAEAGSELHRRFDPERQIALYQSEIEAAVVAKSNPGQWSVSVHADWRPLEAEWRALEADGALTAFQRYDWSAAWYAVTGRHGRAEPLIVVIRPALGEPPAMILPLARYMAHGVRTIGFADMRVSDYAAPVMRRGLDLPPAEARLLWRRVKAALPAADLLHFSKLVPDAGGQANPLLDLGHTVPHIFMSHEVKLVASWRERLEELLGRKFATELERKRRKIERIGEIRLEVAHGGSEADEFFAALQRQHHSRFKSLNRNDVLDDPVWCELYGSLIGGVDARPYATMLALYAGDQLLATTYGVIHDARYLMLIMSFESKRCDNASPGLQVLNEAMAWAADAGLEGFDLTVGDEPYKRSFRAQSRPVYEWMEPLSARGIAPWLTWKTKVWLRRHPGLRSGLKRLMGRTAD